MKIELLDALYFSATKQPTYCQVQAIIQHLNFLLNAQRGSLQHMPDYGLPDIQDLYQSMPYSLELLRQTVKETIERYEPRLNRIAIDITPINRNKAVIQLTVQAHLKITAKLICFSTNFTHDGKVQVIAIER